MEKTKVMIFTDWYLPAYKAGGPIRSVANLVEALGRDVDFSIVTSDRDLNDNEPFQGISLNEWTAIPNARIMYLSPDKQNRKFIVRLMEADHYDRYYLNSLFSRTFTIIPLLVARKRKIQHKIRLAPRGMLGEGALQIKAFKKKMFLFFGRAYGLFRNISWHATGEEEKVEIEQHFGSNTDIGIAANLPDVRKMDDTREKVSGKLNLLFYSRISEKKNLLYALEVLRDGSFNGIVRFHIYGPIEDTEYWNNCLRLIEKLNADGLEVEYRGGVSPDQSEKMFHWAHVMFFPTKHENFGHVIAEALATGIPVIASQNTPWRDLKSSRAGADVPLEDKSLFAHSVQHFMDMDQSEYDKWVLGSRKHFENAIDREDITKRTKALFLANG